MKALPSTDDEVIALVTVRVMLHAVLVRFGFEEVYGAH